MTTDFETLRARVTAAQAALLGPVDKLETLSVAVLLDEALLHADNMTQWMQEWEYQAQLWGQNALHSQAERDEARKMLAECYVLSGADPDGDDWRHLWQTAVAEVRQTMEEHRAEVEALVAERDEARAEMAAIRAALGNGADEAAWRPGETLAEAVGRLRSSAPRCRVLVSRRWIGDTMVERLCPLPAGHEGPHAEALGNGGPNG